jgi:HAE1 family hydrophobic/amphiphilic exporter-1
MKLVEASIHRPVTVFMVTAGALLFGAVALSRLAVELLPDVSYPTLTVRTDLPDAAPSDVEQFVTRPVEEAVGVVAGLQRMHSVSRPGQSEVTLEFDSGQRMDLASLAVREKLDLIELPREAERPAILRFDPSLDPILRLRVSGGGNLQRLRRIAERTIKTDLEAVPGVAAVRVAGGEEEEIQVDVDAGRLSSAGLTLAEVTRRLGDENVNLAGGSLTEGASEYLVRAANELATPDEIAGVILAARDNGLVRVSDVATVRRGARDRTVVARVAGEEAVELAVYREGDANTVRVAEGVTQRLRRLQLPKGMSVITVSDQSRFIRDAVNDVTSSAWLGGLLAVLVLFAFLRDLRSTVVIALSIPISVLVTFVIMYRFGLSLNLMSLGGLALGVGMLVDNSIVVLESIVRKREQGLAQREAAAAGTSSVAMAVTASTLTTVAVFLPLVFVEGLAGQLIRDQALTVSFSLLASLAVALTLVPTLAAIGSTRGARPAATAGGRARRAAGWALFALFAIPLGIARGGGWVGRRIAPAVAFALRPVDRALAWLHAVYPPFLAGALARPRRTMGIAAAGFGLSLAVAAALPVNLFPTPGQGEFRYEVRLPEGTALHVTDALLSRVAAGVAGDPRVRHVYTSSGQTDIASFAGSALEANRGEIAVLLKRATDRDGEAAIAEALREALAEVPGATWELSRPALLTFRRPIEVEVYAHDLDTLRALSNAVAARLAGVRGVEDVETSVRLGDPEVQIAFDRDRLAAMNLDPLQASRLVRNAVQGEAATQFNDLDRKLDVRVRATEAERNAVVRLANLEVGRNRGQAVPLGSVARVSVERGPGEIRRIAQQRAGLVTAELTGRDLGSAARDIEAQLAGLDVPPGARVALAGQNRELGESFASLRFAIVLAIFLVYLVMASQFESLLHPFVVMFSMPLAVVGVVAGLAVTGTPMSVMVLIGLVVLAGIVVNNAIVLVDAANQLRRDGRAKREALIEAGRLRLRPILMTTVTTVLGLLPMALGFGEGAEIRAPLAVTLIGGLGCATLLTLVVIPVVYDALDRSERSAA